MEKQKVFCNMHDLSACEPLLHNKIHVVLHLLHACYMVVFYLPLPIVTK